MRPKLSTDNPNLSYAIKIAHATCCLAGSPSYLDDIRDDFRQQGILRAVRDHDTPALFDWLVDVLSFQGISDAVAAGYITTHGTARGSEIASALAKSPSCPKLGGYWSFHDCQYQKGSFTCSELDHIDCCPLPRLPLRNGRLNQMAYSLFLFMRDIAEHDFVGWIDRQLGGADSSNPDRLSDLRESILAPLRGIYGVADKVLAMALSHLMMGTSQRRPLWLALGGTFIVVDTLVHNYLSRTGILRRFQADHPYGPRCYQPGGCGTVLRLIAAHIDAREFNGDFPANFPRFIQSSIWRYCSENGLEVCNGNRVDDSARCNNAHCQLFYDCDRVALDAKKPKIAFFQ